MREAGRAGALSAIAADSLCVDGKVYFGDGMAFIKVRGNLVELYKNSPKGVVCVIYGTPQSQAPQ